MNALPSYVAVTPVPDEVRHIEATLASMSAQAHLPARWVIVDDGSSDVTGALLDRHAARVSWIEVIHRPYRRKLGDGVMDAFHAGFERLAETPWDFLVKLDGDLSFEPDYFARCLAHFAAEPTLGIGGGTVCVRESHGGLGVEFVGDPLFHVRGATKIYRRACWEQIAPLPRTPGWDTVDEVCANRHGWRTRTFTELAVVQHKPTRSADGCWANAFKNGRANYLTGYHPAFMLAKCVKRVPQPPLGVEAAGLFAGFVSGYWKRLPRAADSATVRYLRQQQLRRMLLQPSIYG